MANPDIDVLIVGFGWVGQANAIALAHMGYRVGAYDPHCVDLHYAASFGDWYDRIVRLHMIDVASAPCVVCVGEHQVRAALDGSRIHRGRRVILRSTILPSEIDALPFDIYMPEFLHEKSAVTECMNPKLVVLGRRSAWEPDFVTHWRKAAERVFTGSPKEAAFLKYMSNTWNATKVAYVNEVGTAAAQMIGEGRAKDLTEFMFPEPYMKFGRAYGGHCLPKDMRAFREAFPETPLLEGVERSNALHARRDADLPEVFSAWGG